MSNQYEECSLCGQTTLVSQTNCDEDLGIIYVGNNLVCPDCCAFIRDVSEEDEEDEEDDAD